MNLDRRRRGSRRWRECGRRRASRCNSSRNWRSSRIELNVQRTGAQHQRHAKQFDKSLSGITRCKILAVSQSLFDQLVVCHTKCARHKRCECKMQNARILFHANAASIRSTTVCCGVPSPGSRSRARRSASNVITLSPLHRQNLSRSVRRQLCGNWRKATSASVSRSNASVSAQTRAVW